MRKGRSGHKGIVNLLDGLCGLLALPGGLLKLDGQGDLSGSNG
jgi:hypothetical protein